ncbi:MAG: 4Fe-4S binding protein [Coriobacteriaceae bacterium]|jgi:ferredoxin-type protein NapH|nr:4Fe-4S binding protein [Coriobacteriaceae bacterium]
MKIRTLRWIVLAATFIVIATGLVLNTNQGTISSFGWQAIAAICPLGAIESILASKGVFPRALVVLLLTAGLVVVFGKAFCAWVCPIAPVRAFTEWMGRRKTRAATRRQEAAPALEREATQAQENAAVLAQETGSKHQEACAKGCDGCAEQRAKLDSRHIVLGGSLLSAAVFGFPVFCLICPIGLVFATIIVVWQWIGVESISLSLLIYPLLLVVELLLLRKWCARFCPLGALLSLLSLKNRLFRPQVDKARCLREQGSACQVCHEVCPEGLDPHYASGMHECTKCAICKDKCPVNAIGFLPKRLTSPSGETAEKDL